MLMAMLCSARIVSQQAKWQALRQRAFVEPSQIKLITFGQPRVGNASFAALVKYMVPDYWRLWNEGDPVPKLPKYIAFNLDNSLPHFYCGKKRYKHAGYPVLMEGAGTLVFAPGALDEKSSLKPAMHRMALYEANLENFLLRRRQWLWRKAVFAVRIIVKLRAYCREVHLERTSRPAMSPAVSSASAPGVSAAGEGTSSSSEVAISTATEPTLDNQDFGFDYVRIE